MLAHVSGGSEPTLKPGLNIIGGVQPRAFNDPIPCMPPIGAMLAIEDMPDVADIPDIVSIPDIGDILGIAEPSDMDEVGVGCEDTPPIGMLFIAASVDMLDAPMSILFFMPDMVIEDAAIDVFDDALP